MRALLAKCTSGPWGYDLNHTVGRHEDGEWEESVVQLPVGAHKRRPTAQEQADMIYIARINPDAMKKVLKALELTEKLSPDLNSTRDAMVAAMQALDALNGLIP